MQPQTMEGFPASSWDGPEQHAATCEKSKGRFPHPGVGGGRQALASFPSVSEVAEAE